MGTTTVPLAFEYYLEAVSANVSSLAALAPEVLERRVPTCPEWTGRDLLGHLQHVLEFWRAQVVAGDTSGRFELPERARPGTAEPGLLLEEAAEELVTALRGAGSEAPCWNWSGENLTTGWVARRMALEAAVHRCDGELISSAPTPVEAELAVDGIDEFLHVHLRTDLPEVPEASLGGSLCLACADAEDAWTVEVGGGRLRVRHERGPASAYVRAAASDLFLFVWNRLGVDALELTGDRAVVSAWASLPH